MAGLVRLLEPAVRDTHSDEGVGGEDKREPSQHGLHRAHTEVGQTELLLEQEVVGFGLPPEGIVAQNALRAQAQIAADKAGDRSLTRASFGEHGAHRVGNAARNVPVGQPTGGGSG